MSASERQWDLPAAYGPDGAMLTLKELMAADTRLRATSALSQEQRVALVRVRWEAGEWRDVWVCGEVVDLPRAIREVEGDTELGQLLLEGGEIALGMVLDRVQKAQRP